MTTVDQLEEGVTSRLNIERKSDSGEVLGVVVLDEEYFGYALNVPLLHQVVKAQLAAKRAGTHSTKTRAEVAGGGAKPYRQKGTGRARQGSIRAPQFVGGGIVFGPKPRSYVQATPRKMVRLALRAALSDRAAEGRICLVDHFSYEVPKTKDALATLDALGIDGRVLVVLTRDDAVAERSFSNLPHVDLVEGGQLTALDVVVSDWVVFTDGTIPGTVSDAPKGAVVDRPSRPRPRAGTAEEPAQADAVGADVDETAEEPLGADAAGADVDDTAEEPAQADAVGADVDDTGEEPVGADAVGADVDDTAEEPLGADAAGADLDETAEEPGALGAGEETS